MARPYLRSAEAVGRSSSQIASVPIHVHIQLAVVPAIRELARPPCNHPPVINAGIQFLDDYRREVDSVVADSGRKDRRAAEGAKGEKKGKTHDKERKRGGRPIYGATNE